jgi:hypothetical protein
MTTLEFRWTVSRGRDSYGYNICSLYVDGRKVSSCNGGGYDMQGTALGNWIAKAYADRLLALQPADMPEQSHWEPAKNAKRFNDGKRVSDGRYFYGLTYHDPNYDPGKAVVGKDTSDRTMGGTEGETVEQAEAAGKSLGLERYQAFYSASSKVPTDRHTVPLIDGACGISSVQSIMKAIGLELQYVPTRSRRDSVYTLIDNPPKPRKKLGRAMKHYAPGGLLAR